MKVDVVGVEVVGNVGRSAGPGAERVELGFGLGHVAGEVRRITEVTEFFPGIGVNGVPAFVDLHGNGDVLLAGDFDE